MIVAFYGCQACGKVMEEEQWKVSICCPRCGGKRVHPHYMGVIGLIWFSIWNPKYVIKALKNG